MAVRASPAPGWLAALKWRTNLGDRLASPGAAFAPGHSDPSSLVSGGVRIDYMPWQQVTVFRTYSIAPSEPVLRASSGCFRKNPRRVLSEMIAARKERNPDYRPPTVLHALTWMFLDGPANRILSRMALHLLGNSRKKRNAFLG